MELWECLANIWASIWELGAAGGAGVRTHGQHRVYGAAVQGDPFSVLHLHPELPA